MIIIPAIDLYQAKVVRLTKGDKANCKFYSSDPLSVAKKWSEQGATLLHLVDLSAAFSEGDNKDIISLLRRELDISIEVGGGIRSLERVRELISIGVDKLILGTAATNPDFLQKALNLAGPDKIAVAVDEKEGKIAVSGWEKSFDMTVIEYLNYLRENKVKEVIYTDVSSDGMLVGPNLEKVKKFTDQDQLNFILAGGISSLEDIKSLKKEASFAKGIIVGKALYEKKIDLKEAIRLTVDND